MAPGLPESSFRKYCGGDMARCYGTFAVLDGALSLALHGTEHDSHAIGEVPQSLAEKAGRKAAPHGQDGL